MKNKSGQLDKPTPETDACIIERRHIYKRDGSNQLLELIDAEFARKLERERDEARAKYATEATEHMLAVNKLCNERDEAREKAERYRLEANAMMLQRDELKKIVEQRILVGAEIHDKANSLLKQSNRTEAECEYLRKQLTAATSALRQIHLEVGDWIRSTIIVEE